ncbi:MULTISPECIES: NAD(P)(+) transhydrogenase (Re/Si-specific) subunit beta [Proteiniphilum]|jgi:NAD(P) transhydrogenase subunit beta|uniref:NAD(P)(+) transhydrogenase (Re/Si-specific) subunit beta n=1 Tax=Proteiniphilum TaxID=294702 RepID=UPI001EEA288A|nr:MULTISPECIES: NAD(P)(+) transhydrogenase (Re/Si-specific) subunit beta [Proteiniphilum]MDD4778836.1 NAD(P)(+) transhydrogenase (Re/Si-specific) subunit beta [Fermentimonas sp.]ULB33890.1 NAD(P)(+) transhydrogenase (Re/Si-specific) subunit beta [Proteiniphilum propionicum]
MSSTVYIIICALLSVAVLLGISLMSRVKTAVAGNLISAFSVFLAIIVTLLFNNILESWSIYLFMLVGVLIGGAFAVRVKMIQMPQLVALFNGVGGLASALVGILSLLGIGIIAGEYLVFVNVTSVLAIIIGLVTLTGSLVAAGKLHKLLPQKPVIWKNHSAILNFSLIVLIMTAIFSAFSKNISFGVEIALVVSIIVSLLFGYAFAIRVGGADMPITISLLNSLSGVAGAIAGMAVSDLLLVSVGGIVGASGLLLTQIMCRAMNRSLKDILTGKTSVTGKIAVTGKIPDQIGLSHDVITGAAVPGNDEHEPIEVASVEVSEKTTEEILKSAKSVIIVPGYGMALAQAQHLVRQLADILEANGAEVKYAIHPVAGRMPGHMNVLLAEADVPYEKLFEMDAVNDDFVTTDVAIVIGANDVINPAAREAKDTPIFGMPVLNVDQAKEIFICNYDLNPGYAGVDNPLYRRTEGLHLLLGDAKDSLNEIIAKLN